MARATSLLYGAFALMLGSSAEAQLIRNAGDPTTPTPPAAIPVVNGSERLAWDQDTSTATPIASLRFIAFIDSQRVELEGVTCRTASEASAVCSSALPRMTPGVHSIEVALVSDQALWRSAAITVQLASPETRATGAAGASMRTPSAQPPAWNNVVVAAGLDDVVDLAIDGRGRIVTAERDGRIRVFEDDREAFAWTLDGVDLRRGGLMAIAAGGDAGEATIVYAAYAAADGVTVARLEFADRRLRSRMVVLTGLENDRPEPDIALGIGLDNELYVALDDGGAPQAIGDVGSFRGKVLRVRPDGTTPLNQPMHTPVYAFGFGAPRSITWAVDTAGLWLAGAHETDRSTLRVIRQDAIEEIAIAAAVSSVAAYRGARVPALAGELLIATSDDRGVFRLTLPKTSDADFHLTHMWSQPGAQVTGVAVTPLGDIYVTTKDGLHRIQPF